MLLGLDYTAGGCGITEIFFPLFVTDKRMKTFPPSDILKFDL